MKSAGQVSAIALVFTTLTSASIFARDNTPVTYPGYADASGYNVKFKDESYTIDQHLSKIGKKFDTIPIPFIGYGADLSKDDLAAVYTDPEVDFIEKNCYGTFTIPVASAEPAPEDSANLTRRAQDANAGYALTYLSERSQNPTDNTYYYPDNAGQGVDIYIVDTGITVSNAEFGTRVNPGADYSGTGYDDTYPGSGHGTGVAACAAGTTKGTSKQANIWNYKITERDNPKQPEVRSVERALGEIITNNIGRKNKPEYKGAIINISLAMPDSRNLLFQINRAVQAGITVVVAAGNDNADGANQAPCKYANSLCVGASNERYQEASFSNWGKSLFLYAPGEQVATISKTGANINQDGTSFSSPYTAGIAAIFYGVEGKSMTPSRVRDLLKQNAENNILTGIQGNGPNVLANNGKQKAQNNSPYIGAPPPPPASAPPPSSSSASPAPPPPSPTPPPPAKDTCKDSYKFFFDHFEISGQNFDAGKFGKDGSGLKDQIKGCGALTKWSFNYLQNDPNGMQWSASGNLPIGTKACVGRAVVSAGGAGPDGCTGAG